ncbi:FYVE zinc finger domain-containing protein [Dyella nitratireducens]|uniref:FYVE zinc finger domain-containing protein n=1 Tax=Dyella nitratireducens TaxID=1849580 RepID=UPI00166F1758|nr:FYVE zinc finger domain-containing protein [Dyella nitratireducens]
MPLAQGMTRGVGLATMNGASIPELGLAPNIALDVNDDIHFGINVPGAGHALYADLNAAVQLEQDLIGLGPRTIDIKRRGGRTAEDDWKIFQGQARARPQTGMTGASYARFNQLPIKSTHFPAGAHISNVDKAGQPKNYSRGATGTKADAGGLEMGTRWSKTALESALARPTGRIHFHLTGMGDLAGPLGKTGGFSHNVTSRELRYVRRFWLRFQDKVTFYNGYTAGLAPVMVLPPWIAAWQADTPRCARCNEEFSRAFPVRWRHHCRLCGSCVCDDCSPDRVRLRYPVQRPGDAREAGAVRVCHQCYVAFNRGAPSTF